MPAEATKEESKISVDTRQLYNGFWAVVVLILGLGVNGMIDHRIMNHPKIIETSKTLAIEAAKLEKIDKTVVRIEVLLEGHEKLLQKNEAVLKELLEASRGR